MLRKSIQKNHPIGRAVRNRTRQCSTMIQNRPEEPPVKRPRVARGEDGYVPGNIIEVELCNFMTYEHFRCKPGSRLNLVVGPNGSGKSSIVCAIALGLGGEPQLLGRATSIGAYVKRGKESGYVKISLRGDTEEEKLIITRKMDTRNKSEWLFNGKVVLKREIVEITKRFNIQVNNLTQFLPQDRVCEFAKLTPVQLLEKTEKAVGDPQLPIQHSTLIKKSHELTNIEIAIKQNGETINLLKAQNAEIEKDVERVRRRDELLLKVELMKKKLPWLVYEMKKVEYVAAKQREKKAKMKFTEVIGPLKDLRERIETKKQEKAVLDLDSKKAVNLMNDNANRRINLTEKENFLGVELRLKYHRMEELRKQEDACQRKILKVREDLAAAETELQNLPCFEALSDLLERLGSQITELEVSANQKRLQKSEMERCLSETKGTLKQCTDRLKEMETTSYKCLLALKRNGAEKIVEAYQWLQQHRQALNKEVFGPVLLEVNVSDRVHAAYLEGHMAYHIWKSFITQDPRDRDFLVKNLASYDVHVLNYTDHGYSHQNPCHISTEMQELGISSRLDQVFDAPYAVREVLVEQFGLADSYIGSAETDRQAEKVAKLGVTDFWTPEHHYRWYKSRYGGPDSAVVEPVDESILIQSSCDVGEIESLKRRKYDLEGSVANLEERIKTLQVEIRTLENEASMLQKEREVIISNTSPEVKKRRELKACVDQRKKKLEAMENVGGVDVSVERIMDKAKHINFKRLHCAIDLKNSLEEAASLKWSYTAKLMASVEFAAKIGALEVTLSEHQRFADQVSVQLEHCKNESEEHRWQLLTAKRHAESVAFITLELEKSFLEMPTTVADLEAAIQDTISQANSILSLNQNVLHEYEYRQRKIVDISKKVEADSEELRRCLAEIESLKQSWLPTLRNLVSRINDTFSRNFQEMAVAGEVLLEEHDKDFAQFGILIKVKFRQSGQLQVLSAHHQSGGERSVSTILYLVSLQDLTNCPFSVVDEINQGMDPINERKMFQQLVRAANQQDTPQCFMVTPKLLPDLEFSEACSILCIMNGPWNQEPSEVWRSGNSWGAVTGSIGRTRC